MIDDDYDDNGLMKDNGIESTGRYTGIKTHCLYAKVALNLMLSFQLVRGGLGRRLHKIYAYTKIIA